jgi:hypothetical protein
MRASQSVPVDRMQLPLRTRASINQRTLRERLSLMMAGTWRHAPHCCSEHGAYEAQGSVTCVCARAANSSLGTQVHRPPTPRSGNARTPSRTTSRSTAVPFRRLTQFRTSIVHRGALGMAGVVLQGMSRFLTSLFIRRIGGPVVPGTVPRAISTPRLRSAVAERNRQRRLEVRGSHTRKAGLQGGIGCSGASRMACAAIPKWMTLEQVAPRQGVRSGSASFPIDFPNSRAWLKQDIAGVCWLSLRHWNGPQRRLGLSTDARVS